MLFSFNIMFEFDGHTSFAIRMSSRYYFDLDNFTWLSPRMAHNLYEKDFKKLKKKNHGNSKLFADRQNSIMNRWMSRCISYSGQMNTLTQSPTVNKARGSLYQAVQFTGFLRCAIHGHISKIIVTHHSYCTTISLRDNYGYELLNSADYEKCKCKLIANIHVD